MRHSRVRFDIVQAATTGYRQLWQERRIFMHLAMLPLSVKIATFIAIMMLDLEYNYLRQGLLLLPSFFLEGWLVAVAIGYVNRQAGPPPDNFFSSRETLSCMVLYVMSKLTATFISSFALASAPNGPSQPVPDQMATDPTLFPFAFIVLAMALWAFRLLWLYVPAALGYGLEDFLKRVNRFYFSFQLLGFWIFCFVPPALMLVVIAKILPHPEGQDFLPYIIIMAIAQGCVELCIILVSGLGFAHAVRAIMSGDAGRPLRP